MPLFRQIYRLTKRKRQRKRSQRQRPRKPPRSCRSELKFVFVFMCVHAYIVFGSESNIHSHTHHIENPNIPLARTRVCARHALFTHAYTHAHAHTGLVAMPTLRSNICSRVFHPWTRYRSGSRSGSRRSKNLNSTSRTRYEAGVDWTRGKCIGTACYHE